MKFMQITKLAVLAFSLAMLQFSVTEAYGQSLNGQSLGSEARETLRGDRPGGGGKGPVESGDIDIISGNPDTAPDGLPDDPFSDLPKPDGGYEEKPWEELGISYDEWMKTPDAFPEDPFSDLPKSGGGKVKESWGELG